MHDGFCLEPLDARVLLSAGAWTRLDALEPDVGAGVIAVHDSQSLAPTSINSLQFKMTSRATNSGPVGTYQLHISKHGHDFVLVPGTVQTPDGGTCGYSKTGANTGLMTYKLNSGATGTVAFTFTVARGGTYKLNDADGYYERGVFNY
jgi:hypothetical protein